MSFRESWPHWRHAKRRGGPGSFSLDLKARVQAGHNEKPREKKKKGEIGNLRGCRPGSKDKKKKTKKKKKKKKKQHQGHPQWL